MADWPYNTIAWKKLRLAKLNAEPLCYACKMLGRYVPAKAVDHIDAIAKGGEPFPPLNGLMSLCIPCHNSKTNAVDHPNAKSGKRRALKGFDMDGNPIDPNDDWHGEGGENHQNHSDRGPGSKNGKYLVSQGQVIDTDDDLGFS
ncbi:HNH endonuclease [Brucella pituitosa]|uniref:HNH endonuclease n=1 Tax=Brucella pituitosa TaxID=571256 RepID=A0ABS3JU56_9HYPH|nr:HNH endonuclease [Brucella pituitosa]MBO1038194.1 HNH endonuclease [Brucella pituitosa]